EYIAATEASMEAVWIRKSIDGLGSVEPSNKRPMEMLCDNEPVIAIANDPGILKGAKLFQRKYHYINEVIQEREIVLKKVHTDDNVSGPFKPMSYDKHYEHVMAIDIVPTRSLIYEMLLQEAFEIGAVKQYSNAYRGVAKQAFHLKCLPLATCRS
ncbi:hypothetical protein Tco_1462525, partial [Tanacetum coccineum]